MQVKNAHKKMQYRPFSNKFVQTNNHATKNQSKNGHLRPVFNRK